MPIWSIILIAVVVVVAIGWYLTYTAARLDRLHARVEGSLAALDAQLVRRAELALELGNSGELDPASAFLLSSAASASLEAAESARITDEVQEVGIPPERAEVESELTEALRMTATTWLVEGDRQEDLRRRMLDVGDRVSLARRFHNEAVMAARHVRAKPSVRLMRLAGHTHLPQPVEFDDHLENLDAASH